MSNTEHNTASAEALAQLAFDVMGRLSKLASDEDMSLTQLRMLAILRDRSPRMAELALALGIDRSSVSGLIARAEQRGLVQRESAGGDGRGIAVGLTTAGQAFTLPVIEKTAAALEPLLSVLDNPDRDSFDALVAKILGE
jgi:DNA-binding MarR family transcriptional regulator